MLRPYAAGPWLVAGLTVVLGGLLVPDTARADEAAALLRRSQQARFPATDMRASFEIVIDRPGGERLERGGKFLRLSHSADLADRLIVLEEPASVAGMSLLSKDEAGKPAVQWLYLPVYRRARRVALHGAGDGFVGSDFTYADLGRVRTEAGRHRISGDRRIGERDCVVVETLNDDPALPYSRLVSAIDRASGLPLEISYYDRDGKHYKQAAIERVEEVEGHATPLALSMKNLLTGSRSVLRLLAVDYNVGIDGDLFSVESLEKTGPPS